MTPAVYLASDWIDDLSNLDLEVGASSDVPAVAITQYACAKYSDTALERAELLCNAHAFQSENLAELLRCDLVELGDHGVANSYRLIEALYRWFVVLPWRGTPPQPSLDAIVSLATQSLQERRAEW